MLAVNEYRPDADEPDEGFLEVKRADHALEGKEFEIEWDDEDVKSMIKKLERRQRKGELTTLQVCFLNLQQTVLNSFLFVSRKASCKI